jgi:hypothetical protein
MFDPVSDQRRPARKNYNVAKNKRLQAFSGVSISGLTLHGVSTAATCNLAVKSLRLNYSDERFLQEFIEIGQW